ncbi:MAG: hypothetical protein Q4G16_08880 [Cruoricaptor ignavus]|nr:hypothetical protein [Cruoricaptor ignavus]
MYNYIFFNMKKSNFNAKKFLNIKTLSPLESNAVKGGVADVKDKKKEKEIKIDVKVDV